MFKRMAVFGLGDAKDFTDEVCKLIGEPRSEHEEKRHEDGEPYAQSCVNVRGGDVFVISALYDTPDESLGDKFLKLVFFVSSLREASAERITLVLPYLPFQRQDRKTKSRAPVHTKSFPILLKSVLGERDRILTIDPHNLSAFQTGQRLLNDHLESKGIISEWLVRELERQQVSPQNVVVMSPDEGGLKRARFYRDRLSRLLNSPIDLVFVDKIHTNEGVIRANKVIGDVAGKQVIVYDDMISSGKTMVEAMDAVHNLDGRLFAACASHGLFVGPANNHVERLLEKDVRVVVTDTVSPFRLRENLRNRINCVSVAPLIADAIRSTHNHESLSRLL